MDDFKIKTKIWLKANGKDYAWLAQKCYVKEATVRNWMAKKPIPRAKAHIIRALTGNGPFVIPNGAISVTAKTFITIKLDHAFTKRLDEKASSLGQSLEEFLSKKITELGEGEIQGATEPTTSEEPVQGQAEPTAAEAPNTGDEPAAAEVTACEEAVTNPVVDPAPVAPNPNAESGE